MPKTIKAKGKRIGRPKTNVGPCIFPGCGKPMRARGLCATHYDSALRLVRLGRVSWDTLVGRGKCRSVVGAETRAYFLGDDSVAPREGKP